MGEPQNTDDTQSSSESVPNEEPKHETRMRILSEQESSWDTTDG